MTPRRFNAIRDAPLHQGPGHHPQLTITATGCHVWAGSTYGPCWKSGTVGCCLIAHASPAVQRASAQQPRCIGCGRFIRGDDWAQCGDCDTRYPEEL